MSGQGSETERLLRSIVDQVPAMVAYWDADKLLCYANAGYCAWFTPLRDPLGRSRAELFGSGGDATGERFFAEALAGQERRFERRLVNAEGQARRVKVVYRPDRRGDSVAGVFVVLTELDPPEPETVPPAPVADAAAGQAPPPAFAGIPGLTMANALMFLPGRDQVYARVLKQFAAHYREGVPGLDPALQAGRRDEARRVLHSLRGACGAVGATALAAKALELEQALTMPQAAGEDAAAAFAERAGGLTQQLAELTRAIDLRLQVQADLAGTPGRDAAPAQPLAAEARQQLLSDLEALAGLLCVADFKAGAAYRAIAPALRAALGEQALRPLERPLLAYDHDTALQALSPLRARLQGDPAAPAQ